MTMTVKIVWPAFESFRKRSGKSIRNPIVTTDACANRENFVRNNTQLSKHTYGN